MSALTNEQELAAIRARLADADEGADYSADFLRAFIDDDDAQVFNEAEIALISHACSDIRFLLATAEAREKELRALLSGEPRFQQATCCSWSVGSHYGPDGTTESSSLVPAHEPVIDPLSGVLMVSYRAARAALRAEEGA